MYVCRGMAHESVFGMKYGVETHLKDHFPDLLDLESNKNASAAPSLGGMGDTRVRHWNSQFMRQVQDWKMELVENFFDL